MKHLVTGPLVMTVLACLTTVGVAEDKDFVFQAMPAALFVAGDADDFEAEDVSMDETALMPNIAAGVALEFDKIYVDLMGGAGLIVNNTFQSFLLDALVGVHWEPARSFTCGPHLGIIYFPNPEWLEDADVDFEQTLGWMAGVHFAMGDKIVYVVSVDMLSASFDAEVNGEKVDSLDLLGFGFQFGVRGLF